jgi:hypothetical protein
VVTAARALVVLALAVPSLRRRTAPTRAVITSRKRSSKLVAGARAGRRTGHRIHDTGRRPRSRRRRHRKHRISFVVGDRATDVDVYVSPYRYVCIYRTLGR